MGMPFKIRKFVWPKTNVINRTINQSGGGSGGDLELGETSSTAYRGDRGKTAYDYSQVGHVPLTSKDATGGVAGLTLFKINFKNALNTITSFFTNANTVARTYLFQDRDGTIADDTDIQDAKDYADSLVVNLWDDRGVYDASSNLFPATGGSGTAGAILKGDIWTISVIGTLDGIAVALGDTVRALIDTPSQTGANWGIQEHGLGYTPESIANKDTDSTFAANSDTKYSSQKAIKTALDLKTNDTSAAFATRLHGATAKTTLVDADEVNGTDSANSFSLIRTTWTNVKAFLKTYFDTLYGNRAAGIPVMFDGGGSAIANGSTIYIPVPFACTIKAYTILADTGTCTIKTWKKATGTAIPTITDIISTTGVALASGTAIRSATVTDFTTTSIAKDDILAFNITAISGATKITFMLEVEKT